MALGVEDLNFSQISLNGDCGSFFDGETVTCTVDKRDYVVRFSIMAQISKSDFGIFYGVTGDIPENPVHNKHSGAELRSPIYILPAVYVMPKIVKKDNNSGGGVTPPPPPPPPSSGEDSGGGSGENPKPIG